MTQLRTSALLKRLKASEMLTGAEVGVFTGVMSSELLRARPKVYLYMVDNWVPESEQPEAYRATGDYHAHLTAARQTRNERKARAVTEFAAERRTILKMDSVEAARTIDPGSLDFVFLDGDHSYEGVARDIRAWLPTLRPNGILGGHDYNHEGKYAFGVNEAVDEAAREFGWEILTDVGSTWWARR